MDFIKKMRRREYIEMALKTVIGLLIGVIVIFFMEAMIYNIHMKSINENTQTKGDPSKAVYYVVKESADKYDIYVENFLLDGATNKYVTSWMRYRKDINKADLDALTKKAGVLYNFNANLYKVEVDMPNTDSDEIYASVSNKSAYAQIVEKENEDENVNYFENATFTVSFRESAESEYVESNHKDLSYDEFIALGTAPGAIAKNKIVNHTPNAFDIYLNGTHYAVMALFLAIIAGVYVWRFILVNKEYSKIEKRYKKTGKVFKG